MRIGSGEATYEWIENWAKIPDTESARTEWPHHGVAVTGAGDIIAFHQDSRTMLVFDKDGNVRHSWDSGMTAAHGMLLVKEGETEHLWLADCGRNRTKDIGYDYPETGRITGQVIKTTLAGQIVSRLQRPDLPIYQDSDYLPTSVAVTEERHGGNGDIWVADGYGQNHVHRYDKAGDYIGSINGEEGEAGAFDCPHGVWIDRRKSEPELYIADRGNRRLQVYDLEGKFKRAFGSDFLSSPSSFANDGDRLIVAELNARLAVLDIDDNLICYLGDNEEVAEVDGWPNNMSENGEVIPTKLLEPGKFNSPHGIATDSDGNIYVAEWLIGGRFTKLAKH